MRKQQFFAVNGTNAVGVFDNWVQAIGSRQQVFEHDVHKFDNFADAEEHALFICDLDFPINRVKPEHLICNKLVFFNRCRKLPIPNTYTTTIKNIPRGGNHYRSRYSTIGGIRGV